MLVHVSPGALSPNLHSKEEVIPVSINKDMTPDSGFIKTVTSYPGVQDVHMSALSCVPARGGRKGGNAAMAAEAAGHERDTSVAKDRLGGVTGRLELKNRPGGGGGVRGGGGGQRQHMLLDDHDDDSGMGAAAQRRAPPQVRVGVGHGRWAWVRCTRATVVPWGAGAAPCCTAGGGGSRGGR